MDYSIQLVGTKKVIKEETTQQKPDGLKITILHCHLSSPPLWPSPQLISKLAPKRQCMIAPPVWNRAELYE